MRLGSCNPAEIQAQVPAQVEARGGGIYGAHDAGQVSGGHSLLEDPFGGGSVGGVEHYLGTLTLAAPLKLARVLEHTSDGPGLPQHDEGIARADGLAGL